MVLGEARCGSAGARRASYAPWSRIRRRRARIQRAGCLPCPRGSWRLLKSCMRPEADIVQNFRLATQPAAWFRPKRKWRFRSSRSVDNSIPSSVFRMRNQRRKSPGSKRPRSGLTQVHPGSNPGANIKSISHRCHPILVAFVWELTNETIHTQSPSTKIRAKWTLSSKSRCSSNAPRYLSSSSSLLSLQVLEGP